MPAEEELSAKQRPACAELEEAKELLECLENGMGVDGVLNGEHIKGVLMTPEYIERVRKFLQCSLDATVETEDLRRLAYEQKLLAAQQAREAKILEGTGFERCTFFPDDMECEVCGQDHLHLYYRRTCHENNEGQYYCLYCVAEEKAARESAGLDIDVHVELEGMHRKLRDAQALMEEERHFKYAAEASVARLNRLLDDTLDSRDAAKARCRAIAQRILGVIGSQGPEDAEEAVERLIKALEKVMKTAKPVTPVQEH